jgi:hypothetical protein
MKSACLTIAQQLRCRLQKRVVCTSGHQALDLSSESRSVPITLLFVAPVTLQKQLRMNHFVQQENADQFLGAKDVVRDFDEAE